MFNAAVIERLKAEVPEFSGRVSGAADLAALQRANALPQTTPAAHVIPSGLAAGPDSALLGYFRQDVRRLYTVVLTWRIADPLGSRRITDVESLIEAVVQALSGWTPDPSTTSVFRMVRAQLLSFRDGAMVYGLDFALPDQVRIIR